MIVHGDTNAVERRPTIVVGNLFGDINRGGAAITGETLRIAQSTGARVVGISVQDHPSERTHPHTMADFPDVTLVGSGLRVAAGPMAGLRRVIKSLYWLTFPSRATSASCREIVASDLVISKGGYVFVDRASMTALFSMWCTTFPLIFARRVGVPTMTFPTSAGPQKHLGSRLLARWLISNMTVFFARDPISAQTARELVRQNGHVVEVPDIVLGMDPPPPEAVESMCARLGIVNGAFATVTVRLPRTGPRDEVLRAMAGSAQVLAKNDEVKHVVLIDQAEDRADTEALAAELASVCDVVVVGENLSPSELIALYGGSRMTVACRLHSAIFSLVAGTPAVAVSVDPLKAEGVYQSLDLPSDWVVPLAEIERLPATVQAAFGGRELDRATIRQAVQRVASRLEAVHEAVRDVVMEARPRS